MEGGSGVGVVEDRSPPMPDASHGDSGREKTSSNVASSVKAADTAHVAETAATYSPFLQAFGAFFVGNLFMNCTVFLGLVYLFLSWLGVLWILWPLLAVYAYDVITCKAHITGSRSWPAFRAVQLWEASNEYFPISVLAEPDVELPADRRYVVGMHPHGIHCLPMLELVAPNSQFNRRFRGLADRMVGAAALVMFRIPMVREWFMWTNYRDVDRKVLEKTLDEGNSLFLVVGGEAEALLTTYGEEKIVLANRKGFIRLALKHGADLVPTYCFGLNDIYRTSSVAWDFRKWLSKQYQICLPIFWGRWFTPMPFRRPLYFAVGKPIRVPDLHGQDPDQAMVDEYHRRYVEEITALFETHKAAAGMADRTLEIHRS